MTVMLPERTAAPAVAPRMGTTEKLDYCRALAASGLLPAQYRQQPANLLYAVEFADSLGLHPMVAITGVHVIEGKPSASSALISALVRRAGHKLRVRGDATRAVAQIVRADDPEYAFEVAFTLDDAERAGLLGKKVWKNYPTSMLKARAISAVARDACEEALFGIHYTPEELGAEVDGDGNVIEPSFARQAPAQDQWEQAAPAPVQQTPPDVVAAGTADVPAESLAPAGRDYLHEVHAAPDQATARRIYDDAKAEGAAPGYLAQIAQVGMTKPEKAQPSDAEIAADTARARDEMFRAARDAALTPEQANAGFTARYGTPATYGTAVQLREYAAALTAPQAPAAEPVADTLPGAPATAQDRLGALAQLYAAAHATGMSEVEARQVLAQETGGKTTATATGDEIAAVTAALREAAGGAR